MTVYRLTEYYCGDWHDVTEGGEYFEWENEKDIKRMLEECKHHNSHGYLLGYREVTEQEKEAEFKHWAYQRAMQEMYGE
jgi:hypothetical protein